jgi:hypothetical protein
LRTRSAIGNAAHVLPTPQPRKLCRALLLQSGRRGVLCQALRGEKLLEVSRKQAGRPEGRPLIAAEWIELLARRRPLLLRRDTPCAALFAISIKFSLETPRIAAMAFSATASNSMCNSSGSESGSSSSSIVSLASNLLTMMLCTCLFIAPRHGCATVISSSSITSSVMDCFSARG